MKEIRRPVDIQVPLTGDISLGAARRLIRLANLGKVDGHNPTPPTLSVGTDMSLEDARRLQDLIKKAAE